MKRGDNLVWWISPWMTVECQLAKKPILLYSETRKWCTPLIFCTDEKCCIFPGDSDTAAVEISHCDFFVNPSLAIICQKNKNISPNNKWAQKCEIYCQQMFVMLWIVLASLAFKSVLWDERLTPPKNPRTSLKLHSSWLMICFCTVVLCLQAVDLSKPIDKRIYKGTQPTCHDFNQYSATAESVALIVGFSAGQVQYLDPIKKETSKLFNEEVLYFTLLVFVFLCVLGEIVRGLNPLIIHHK